ncbi:MAG: class I SAM-dependent methyltransferase [Aphanocapsa lilacina HA4352-LM1]|nr:class I SAM-dependent methyltransferase [Aphanocapsa lilacina HA4352-LM1]
MSYVDVRDEYISRVVSGMTFADVGGLWGTVYEKISVAHRYGATSLTMIDITLEGSELWDKFRERMVGFGITDYQCIVEDVCKLQYSHPDILFDAIHCAGVLYHHINPLQVLISLRNITRKYLVLTSAITQSVIENEKGRYVIPPSGVIFVPALDHREFEILKQYWTGFEVRAFGLTDRVDYRPDDFGPWWWLPTAQALSAMCESVGLRVQESAHTWGNNAFTLLLERSS